jgi:gliding motility-associated-like protein
MKITALLLAFLLLPFCLPAQNLVPNCDFTYYLSCPTDDGQFNNAENWYTPGEGTSDLCHTCGGGNSGVPNNMWGYESPYSGPGYAHIICYYPFQGFNYREYMEVELACPLDSGKDYRISFFVSCSDNSRYAIDGIGLLLTENALVQEGATVIDPGMPLTVSQDQGVPIYMKHGWKEITGIITASGNERYLTIGNFMQDDELTITEFSGLQTMYTSFYVDMVSVVPLSPMFELGPDTVLCDGDSLLIDATMPCNTVYTWEDGSVNPLRNITQPGTYSIEIQIGCSVISDEIKVSWNLEPVLALPPDTVLCTGSSVLLNAGGGYDSYLWQDGIYRAEVSNPCATGSDEIEIKFRSCIPMLTVPNAFTPNQDGWNDLFLASGVNLSYFRMQVFNRWGELLFETNDISEGWDGRKNGINCPSDVYVWLAYYESEALDIPVRETLKGNVVLVR